MKLISLFSIIFLCFTIEKVYSACPSSHLFFKIDPVNLIPSTTGKNPYIIPFLGSVNISWGIDLPPGCNENGLNLKYRINVYKEGNYIFNIWENERKYNFIPGEFPLKFQNDTNYNFEIITLKPYQQYYFQSEVSVFSILKFYFLLSLITLYLHQ